MTKQAKLEDDLHARIMRNCPKTSTISQYIEAILSESEWLPKLKNALAVAIEKVEITKKDSRMGWPAVEAADKAIAVLKAFIDAVEKR